MSINILCKGLVCLNYLITRDLLRNKSENLVKIIPSKSSNGDNTSTKGSLNNKTELRYSLNALKTIQHQVQHDQQLRLLPFECVKRIKQLKLNHKRPRRRNNIRTTYIQERSNVNNLIRIKKEGHKPNNNIIFGTCNI